MPHLVARPLAPRNPRASMSTTLYASAAASPSSGGHLLWARNRVRVEQGGTRRSASGKFPHAKRQASTAQSFDGTRNGRQRPLAQCGTAGPRFPGDVVVHAPARPSPSNTDRYGGVRRKGPAHEARLRSETRSMTGAALRTLAVAPPWHSRSTAAWNRWPTTRSAECAPSHAGGHIRRPTKADWHPAG